MISRAQKNELKQLIKNYVAAEVDVGRAKSLGDLANEQAVCDAVADASAKLEAVFTYIDREL